MDTELLFHRMMAASEFALLAIDRGILCKIEVDPRGLLVRATTGNDDSRLTYQKFITYRDLGHDKIDVLDFTVRHVVGTLGDKRHG